MNLLNNCTVQNKKKAAITAAFGLTVKQISAPPSAYAQTPIVSPVGANYLCDLNLIIANIIKVSVRLAGVLLFAMLVYGGFLYLTSGGDPKGTEKAKSTLTYAIIGIALLVGAWLILLFIKEFTGVNVTVFSIPCPE